MVGLAEIARNMAAFRAARVLTVGTAAMNTGHDCHVESPAEVAGILLSGAEGS